MLKYILPFLMMGFDVYADTVLVERDMKCLEHILYYEARGEDIDGIYAVSEVIMNRVYSKRFPDSICGVVSQKKEFDGYKTGLIIPEQIYKIKKVKNYFKIIVKDWYCYRRKTNTRLTQGAMFYRNVRTSHPKTHKWFNTLQITARIGKHTFYKD